MSGTPGHDEPSAPHALQHLLDMGDRRFRLDAVAEVEDQAALAEVGQHAVDGAVMLLDCAKGVEAQTKKLFRVCKQRSIPIFSFVNKMDRPGRDAFELIGEVESVLGIGVYPITWPIFRSGVFRGVYHRLEHKVYLFDSGHANSSAGMGAEKAAVILTTNLPFSEWTQVIPNARLCKALIDRITDRAHIIETGNESYRFRRTMERRKGKEHKT